jgi:hypothetical protein
MSRRPLALVVALASFALATPIVAERAPADEGELERALRRSPAFSGLEPGSVVAHELTVPIDIVLIGFDNNDINRKDLSSLLPPSSAPVVRFPQFYGVNGRDVGLDYTFKYSLTRKSRSFEDQFFRFLARTGKPGNPTVYQTEYNDQVNNLVDVEGPVLYIDAPTVERWLEHNANPRTNGYTVYFINWYGRRDFRFHAWDAAEQRDHLVGRDEVAYLVL